MEFRGDIMENRLDRSALWSLRLGGGVMNSACGMAMRVPHVKRPLTV
jgi:hypothetical protein